MNGEAILVYAFPFNADRSKLFLSLNPLFRWVKLIYLDALSFDSSEDALRVGSNI